MSLQDQRSRRRFLVGCAALASTVAGCTERGTTDPQIENDSTSSDTPTRGQETETTTSETPEEPACSENTYEFTDWHTARNPLLSEWRFTVTNLELTPSFTLNDTEETYEMPEDRQLAIITTVIVHPTAPGEPWDGRFVAVLPDGTVTRPQYTFDHPDITDPVETSDIQETAWYRSADPRVEKYGETDVTPAVVQWVCVVPRDVLTDSVEIGLEYPPKPDESPSIQASWSTSTPNAGTTETNGSSENPYALGGWHEALGWKFTVADLRLTSSFALGESEKTYEMPDGEQLAILTTVLINTTPPSAKANGDGTNNSWNPGSGEQFVVESPDGTVVYPQKRFEHPDAGSIEVREIQRIERRHTAQYSPEHVHARSDSPPVILQWLCVVPRDVSKDSVRVGFTEARPDEPTSIQAHWSPEETCQ